MKNDCIYFQIKDKDLPQYHVCIRSGILYHNEKAIHWQNKQLFEQEDYEEYFGIR